MLASILESAQFLDDELSVFKKVLLFLEKYSLPNHSHLSEMSTIFKGPETRPSRRIRFLKTAAACIGLRNNPIMALLLNLFVLWDLLFAQWTLILRKQLRSEFPLWLHTLSTLEAMNSLANFAYSNPDYCLPQLLETDATPMALLL